MMIKEEAINEVRSLRRVKLMADFVVAGGGIAGVCASITAARQGVSTVLIQDRPVLGGNASSEVRLWILGATSHMGNNNRWAREGGVIDEILIENLYRNKEGNPLILDSILLEFVTREPNIKLLLNTAVYDLYKSGNRTIEFVLAFCSQNSTQYQVEAKVFCDATGDGIIGFKAGAAFRMGAESKQEFNELFAPEEAYGQLLGHSIYFYSKRADAPVKYVPPAFALKNIKALPKFKIISKSDYGCRFWWLEFGGRLDTIHDTEEIKWELWKIVYGVWDYIKNSGEFEDTASLTLEWVGTIPGKRESRRFEGMYMLTQNDIVRQQYFEDAVSYGGWAMDLHPADGVYSTLPSCTQWHSKGVYQIPYRCFVSKDIDNLFFAGRLISVTHVAFSSTRVMATCGAGGNVVGMAAALCKQHNLKPADLLHLPYMNSLQNELNRMGQAIPGIALPKSENLACKALITASTTLVLNGFAADGTWYKLDHSVAQLLPLHKQQACSITIKVRAKKPTILVVEKRVSLRAGNFTPEAVLESLSVPLVGGEQDVRLTFGKNANAEQYMFITFLKNSDVEIAQSHERCSGILCLYNTTNKAVSNNGLQMPPDNIGIDSFEFWIPMRRPEGKNLAFTIEPGIKFFDVQNLVNGFTRPYVLPNVWIADKSDRKPCVRLNWQEPVTVSKVILFFDNDFDHPLESVLMGHPEDVLPFCIKQWQIKGDQGELIASGDNNHQSRVTATFEVPVRLNTMTIVLTNYYDQVPVSLFEVIVM